jgi:hypothetical protein
MLSTLAVDVRARTYKVLPRLELRYDISSDLGTVHIGLTSGRRAQRGRRCWLYNCAPVSLLTTRPVGLHPRLGVSFPVCMRCLPIDPCGPDKQACRLPPTLRTRTGKWGHLGSPAAVCSDHPIGLQDLGKSAGRQLVLRLTLHIDCLAGSIGVFHRW